MRSTSALILALSVIAVMSNTASARVTSTTGHHHHANAIDGGEHTPPPDGTVADDPSNVDLQYPEDIEEEPEESNSEYESESYNNWVDNIMKDFENNGAVRKIYGDILLNLVSESILKKAQSGSVADGLEQAYRSQCSLDDGRSLGPEFHQLMEEKTTCLEKVHRNLETTLLTERWDLIIRDQVTSKLLCDVVPRVTSCLSPLVAAVLDCTANGDAALKSFTQYQDKLVAQYCSQDATAVLGYLQSGPASCVKNGIGFFLKYTGPAFLKHLTVSNHNLYPCTYAGYMSSAANVLFRQQCGATSFAEGIVDFKEEFTQLIGCNHLRLND